MPIRRIFSGNSKASDAYIVEFGDNTKIDATKTDLTSLPTDKELNTDLTDKLSVVSKTDTIFLHKNRNGTIAVATGQEPKVWPEDEIIK